MQLAFFSVFEQYFMFYLWLYWNNIRLFALDFYEVIVDLDFNILGFFFWWEGVKFFLGILKKPVNSQ
jgi:hypothetical protein